MSHERTRKNPKGAGRNTVMTADVLQKLEDAFMNAFTDEMACLYAGISPRALYDYCEANPRFVQRKEELKQTPNLAAQKTLVGDLKNTSGARWWAERKMPDFMPKTKVEHGGTIKTEDVTQPEAVKAVVDKFHDDLKAAIIATRKGSTAPRTP